VQITNKTSFPSSVKNTQYMKLIHGADHKVGRSYTTGFFTRSDR